jgi:hypothetical protein
MLGQGILDFWWNLRIYFPSYYAITFKLSQLGGKHLLCATWNEPFQLAEPPDAVA